MAKIMDCEGQPQPKLVLGAFKWQCRLGQVFPGQPLITGKKRSNLGKEAELSQIDKAWKQ